MEGYSGMAERKAPSVGSPDTVSVVGMGMSPEDLSRRALATVKQADVLIGGKRHLSYFRHLPAEKIHLHKNFAQVIHLIKTSLRKKKRIVVISSGDPGYHGIARYLTQHLGKNAIEIIPNITTFQAAFARIKESWDDALLLSSHGRPLPRLASLLRKHGKIGVLTDHRNTPAAIARQVIEKDPSLKNTTVYILEQLGTRNEKVHQCSLSRVINKTFSSLNAMILFPPAPSTDDAGNVPLGIADTHFSHQKGLITKEDIRIFTLAKLRLPREGVLWDIGSGSGSVAVEAALLAPELTIYAVEKEKRRVRDITTNSTRFRVTGQILPLLGEAPAILKGLPQPNRIFIGGTADQLLPILRHCRRRLAPAGKIVMNAATIETVNNALAFFDRAGWIATVTQLNIAHLHRIGRRRRLHPLNPVFIIEGSREQFSMNAVQENHSKTRTK